MEEAETENRIPPDTEGVNPIAAWDGARHRIEPFKGGSVG